MKLSFSSSAVLKMPIALEPMAATYRVWPLAVTAMPTGVARLFALSLGSLGTTS